MMSLVFDKVDAEAKMSATIQASGLSEEGLEVTVVGTAPADQVEQLRDGVSKFMRSARITPTPAPSKGAAPTPEQKQPIAELGMEEIPKSAAPVADEGEAEGRESLPTTMALT